jgi:hypothetical protein
MKNMNWNQHPKKPD